MMHRRLYVLVLPFLVGVAWADQVTLKNGDRLTGKIEKKDGASLTIKSDIFGPVSIPWEAVPGGASRGVSSIGRHTSLGDQDTPSLAGS